MRRRRLRSVDPMGDGELHRATHGLELDDATARALGLELGLPLVLPSEGIGGRNGRLDPISPLPSIGSL